MKSKIYVYLSRKIGIFRKIKLVLKLRSNVDGWYYYWEKGKNFDEKLSKIKEPIFPIWEKKYEKIDTAISIAEKNGWNFEL